MVPGGTLIESTVNRNPEQEGRDVALAKRGDPQAFERLYREHQGRVYSLAVRMTGEEWAEDLTQEVFIRAWQKLRTFREEAAFGTWLHRLAVNFLLSRRETLRRRMQKQHPGGEVLERAAARSPTPGMELDLDRAIRRLPERAKQVFVLFDVEGYPHAEIAEMMDIDPGTSKSQLHRARMMLREYLT
jgi:RNA polymerase sigma-70 factor (ECF subfamily)